MSTIAPEFASLREKIAYEKAERLARYEAFRVLLLEARAAGRAAGEAAVPPLSIVGTAIGLSDEIDYTKPTHLDNEGPCGFAWVKVNPGSCSFARWLLKEGLGHTSYPKGVNIRVSDHGQSLIRKEAHAVAMAEVLKASPLLEGVRIYAGSRMD